MLYVETSLNGITCASGRLRPERNTFGFTPSVRMSTLRCASSRRASSCCSLAVFGASYSNASITKSAPSRARALNALLRASARTCFGTISVYLRGRGPNTVPPPTQFGARIEPWRARPVPFCFHGFWLPPITSPRVLVDALPWRWLARKAFTAWCITGRFTVPSNVSAGRATRSRGVPCAEYAAASTFFVSVCLVSGIGYPCLRTSTIPFFGPATEPRM